MHEAALFRELREKLQEVTRAQGAARICRVRIWVGALSHVGEPELKRGWADIVRGTPAEGATLLVERSNDLKDPRADRVVLRSVDVEDTPLRPHGQASVAAGSGGK